MSTQIRKIIHVDMDAFYASVEQRDNPSLKGRPVIVGGLPEERGVVCAASYEARKFGIHSAMAMVHAAKLCPQAVIIRPNFEKYRKASGQIHEIFHEYTDIVEPLSLDEAFLDVTVNKKNMAIATEIAKEIKDKIKINTGLSASAGVSFCKFLAKAASDYKKPGGLTVVPPSKAIKFIDKLPIGNFYGVGKVTEKKMMSLGIKNGRDLRGKTLEFLEENFGGSGEFFYHLCRAEDDRPVETNWERKSVGREITLREDTNNPEIIKNTLKECANDICGYAAENKILAKTVTLKLKYHDFRSITRSHTLESFTNNPKEILSVAVSLLDKTDIVKVKVRLLGISVSNFKEPFIVDYRSVDI
ncbi:MAG: DNA polymerase IV [Candidatus Goldbacteria bacterium]|nr:DNA polymerase IV [Candidatus Goldiibacteriota bacterium]